MNEPPGKIILKDFIKRLPKYSKRLLMLDYDGTLAPFGVERESVQPYRGIKDILGEILHETNTRVVIISGRGARDLQRLLDMDIHPEIWGSHGCERIYTDGNYELIEDNENTLSTLENAKNWANKQEYKEQYEIKPLGVALHWRGLSLEKKNQLRDNTISTWKQFADRSDLKISEFDGGIELKSVRLNKGDSVRILINEMSGDLAAAYLGDDLTDEDAFKEIRGMGLGILVGKEWRPTAAEAWLVPPKELIQFLKDWHLQTK
jgi:trehalose 6-phosphate phosphatase